jgi:hypothetical protein
MDLARAGRKYVIREDITNKAGGGLYL